MKKPTEAMASRDPVRPPEYYRTYIEQIEKLCQLGLKTANPVMFLVAADYSVRMARAAYSAGDPLQDCREQLKRAADYQIRFFTEGVKSRLDGLRQIEMYLEEFSAAYLVGAAGDVIAAFERVRPAKAHPWERALLGAFEAVLLGRAVPVDDEGMAAAARSKEYAALPALFEAVGRRDVAAFTEALEVYATKAWGGPADRVAKKALSQPYPDHSGKWSFFCAALCAVMGVVPPLSKKALQYVPVELVES